VQHLAFAQMEDEHKMLVKRLLMFLISLILGGVVTWLIVRFVLGTTVAEYGGLYFFLTTFFFGAFFAIWLDLFMGTELLPE
jgi:hypothetical protein